MRSVLPTPIPMLSDTWSSCFTQPLVFDRLQTVSYTPLVSP